MQALEEENQKLIDELNVQSSETESDLAAAEAAKEDYVSQLDQLIADRNAQAERKRKHAVRQKRTRMPRTTTPAAATRLPARVTRAMF